MSLTFFPTSNSDVNGELASVSKDGLCGRDHGNTRCGDRPEGGVRPSIPLPFEAR